MSVFSLINTHIKTNDIVRLNSIFGKLGWRMHVNDESVFNYTDTFNRFCEFLACLNEEEIDLVLNLTENFLHCPYTTYPKLMRETLTQIPDIIINSCKNVFLIPLINPDDIGKTKSSTGGLYGVLHTVIPQIKKFDDKNVKSYDNPKLLSEKQKNRKDSLILLYDDFIGSGDTAIKALRFYNDNIRNNSDIPLVVSLVAQIQGLMKIEDFGFRVYTAERRERCISDSAEITNKYKAIKTIRKIENRMKVSKQNRLGYKKSQALVSMIRTPNNTLPIYWWSKKPDGEEWNGIFRR